MSNDIFIKTQGIDAESQDAEQGEPEPRQLLLHWKAHSRSKTDNVVAQSSLLIQRALKA